MMLVPLPPFALDLLFSFNIALSLVVLMVASYTKRTLDFASFPSVLLMTTLMRLSLNVASTRAVLLNGHTGTGAAGQVIESFAHVLIGGSFAVGIVVFAILTIINFVVVTKGAGRIAEVSARFALDAMPGKQMAIDADLAAGAIDDKEARRRRNDVTQEAEFYGSMDGASKFVRGDAIAGIMILFINVIGGLVIGTFQHGLPLATAVDNYVLLAIGDGLVAQVPALVISVAAGLIVSRVPTAYRVLLGGVVIGGATIRPDKLLAINAGEASGQPAFAGEPTRDPSFGCEALWIDAGLRDLAIADGYLVVDASTVVATQLNQLLVDRPQSLLGPDEVLALIEGLKDRASGLVETVYPQPLSLAAMTRLLRSLLEEGVSISHLLPIFASLSASVQQTLDHDRLIEMLRIDLGGYIVGRICGPADKLPVITLDGALESMIMQGMIDPATNQPVIEPDLARSIGDRIREIMAQRTPDQPPCALVVQPRVRRAVTALLKLRAPQCLVISIAELPAVQPIEVVAVVGGAAEAPVTFSEEPGRTAPKESMTA
jgi:flagellar biosynthesis component FlhA